MEPPYGSIGVLLANTESMIVDVNAGRSLPVGETGELWVRGPQVMKGDTDSSSVSLSVCLFYLFACVYVCV